MNIKSILSWFRVIFKKKTRHFVIYYIVTTKDGRQGFGECSISSHFYPKKELLCKQLIEANQELKLDNISIINIIELNKRDMDSYNDTEEN